LISCRAGATVGRRVPESSRSRLRALVLGVLFSIASSRRSRGFVEWSTRRHIRMLSSIGPVESCDQSTTDFKVGDDDGRRAQQTVTSARIRFGMIIERAWKKRAPAALPGRGAVSQDMVFRSVGAWGKGGKEETLENTARPAALGYHGVFRAASKGSASNRRLSLEPYGQPLAKECSSRPLYGRRRRGPGGTRIDGQKSQPKWTWRTLERQTADSRHRNSPNHARRGSGLRPQHHTNRRRLGEHATRGTAWIWEHPWLRGRAIPPPRTA